MSYLDRDPFGIYRDRDNNGPGPKAYELEKIAVNSAKDIATSTDNMARANPRR